MSQFFFAIINMKPRSLAMQPIISFRYCVWHLFNSFMFIVINVPFCPLYDEKGATACCTPVFPIVPLWESS